MCSWRVPMCRLAWCSWVLEPTRGWDWCSGYHYSDNEIIGFGHTHLSGTGIGDLGDIALLPVSDDKQASTIFSHDNETVKPGYYAVKLTNPGVNVELDSHQPCGLPSLHLRRGTEAEPPRHRPEARYRLGRYDRLPPDTGVPHASQVCAALRDGATTTATISTWSFQSP